MIQMVLVDFSGLVHHDDGLKEVRHAVFEVICCEDTPLINAVHPANEEEGAEAFHKVMAAHWNDSDIHGRE